MGYCTDTAFITGYVSEEVDQTTSSTSWSFFVDIIYSTDCSEDLIDAIGISNPIDSEMRWFSIFDQVDCGRDCDVSTYQRPCGGATVGRTIISESGENSSLPQKYRKLYDNLNYWADGGTDEEGDYIDTPSPLPDNYRSTDPTVLKSYIILSLVRLFPEEMARFATSNRCQYAEQSCKLCPIDLEL